MNVITVDQVEHLAFVTARELMQFDEPIPDFNTRFPHILESCLYAPFQRFDGKLLYPSMLERASVLFYFVIKNHPFQNGNKRMAVIILLTFLFMNGKWLDVDQREFYRFAVWVAESHAKLKGPVVEAIRVFIGMHMKNLDREQYPHAPSPAPAE